MNYKLLWPSVALQPYVQFYGLLQSNSNNQNHIDDLIPPYPGKGLIFSIGACSSTRIYNHQFDINAPEGYFMPQCTNSWHLQINGNLNMLGVFFRPGMFRHFFAIPAHELTDKVLTFEEVGFPGLIELQEKLQAYGTFGDKIQLIELYLKKRLSQVSFHANLTDHFLNLLEYNEPRNTVDILSGKLGRSSRYVRKVFKQDIGITPKVFLKISRFNAAFNLLKADQFVRLSDIAYRLNYFDQSHFIREFRYFTGMTPLQFLKNEHPIQAQLYWREERLMKN